MALILSVEFTDTECKVVQADQGKNGKISVRSMSSFELPKPEDQAARVPERAAALKDHLKAQRITVKNAVVVVPKNFVMARTVTLPSTVEDEIAGMARFEAERHIPFNAERHIVSYHVLARQGMQGSDVLLAAVDLPIAEEYLDVCVKAGLSVSGITVSSIAMFNAFSAAEKSAMEDRTIMVLNVGCGATDLVIASNGNISFTRGSTTGVSRLLADLADATGRPWNVNQLAELDALEPQLSFSAGPAASPTPQPPPASYDDLPSGETSPGFTVIGTGATDSTMPPPSAAVGNPAATVFSDWLNKLLQEVRRTYEFANREFNCPMVNQIYLTGEGAIIKKISQYFQANFNIEATVFNPLNNADVAGKAKKQNVPPQVYAVAVGGTIGRQPGTVHINLLPGSYTEALTSRRQQRSYIITGVLVLLAMVVGYVYLSDVISAKKELLEEIEDQNRKDKARVSDLTIKKERLRIIRENVQDDKGALAVLRFISSKEYFPDSVTLNNFDYKRADYVKLTGVAKDLPSANQLVNDLRGTGFFEDARMDNTEPNITLRNRPSIPVLGWSATFTFPKPQKAKPRNTPKPTDEEDQ